MLTKIVVPMLLLGVMLFGSSSPAKAQGRGDRLEKMKISLGLTESQVTEMKAVLKAHREAALPLRQELREKNKALRAAMTAPEPNPTTVGQLVLAKKPIRVQLRALNRQLRSDILEILTPEQQQKFKQLRNVRRPPRFPGSGE